MSKNSGLDFLSGIGSCETIFLTSVILLTSPVLIFYIFHVFVVIVFSKSELTLGKDVLSVTFLCYNKILTQTAGTITVTLTCLVAMCHYILHGSIE